MKKILLSLSGLLLFLIVGVNFSAIMDSKNSDPFNVLHLQKSYAQGSEETLQGWHNGSQMGKVTTVVGYKYEKVQYSCGYYSCETYKKVPIYEEIDCCVSTNNQSACNFSNQDSRC